MSLAVVIKGPEGIVLAADSRVTLEAQRKQGERFPVNFDNATKLLSFDGQPFIGAVTYGAAVIGARTAHSFLPEFEVKLRKETGENRLSVFDFSKKLSGFFIERWRETMPKEYQGPPMVFIVGGYDEGDAYGKVFLIEIPRSPEPAPRTPEPEFGMTWGGQLEILSRIIHGFDPTIPRLLGERLSLASDKIDQLAKGFQEELEFPIPWGVLPLQDCVDLATFAIRATMTLQGFAIVVRGVGGAVDVAVITRTQKLKFLQKRELRGELGANER